jgi:hypothetical protein
METPPIPTESPLLMAMTDARLRLGLSNYLFKKEIYSGRLCSIRIGGRRLVPAHALVDFVEHRISDSRSGQLASDNHDV